MVHFSRRKKRRKEKTSSSSSSSPPSSFFSAFSPSLRCDDDRTDVLEASEFSTSGLEPRIELPDKKEKASVDVDEDVS